MEVTNSRCILSGSNIFKWSKNMKRKFRELESLTKNHCTCRCLISFKLLDLILDQSRLVDSGKMFKSQPPSLRRRSSLVSQVWNWKQYSGVHARSYFFRITLLQTLWFSRIASHCAPLSGIIIPWSVSLRSWQRIFWPLVDVVSMLVHSKSATTTKNRR